MPTARERSLIGDVIVEHNKVFQEHGRVMFGRFEILCPRWWNMMYNFLNAYHVEWGAKLMITLREGKIYQRFSNQTIPSTTHWKHRTTEKGEKIHAINLLHRR
jgi:hypothetical protein